LFDVLQIGIIATKCTVTLIVAIVAVDNTVTQLIASYTIVVALELMLKAMLCK